LTCTRIALAGGGVAWVCSRGAPRAKLCAVCRARPSTRLCDTRVAGGTCDVPLCDTCTNSPREGVDYCPRHAPRPPKETRTTMATATTARRGGERAPLVNEVSWSKSRSKKKAECERAYWLHYYGAWGGWERNAPERTQRLYMLKHLSSRASWAGNKVHDVAKRVLEALGRGVMITADTVVAETHEVMKKELAQSRKATYRQVKKGFGLIEHELGCSFAKPAYFEKAFDQVADATRALFASETVARASCSSDVKPIDELDGFLVDGAKVYVAPDLAFARPEDEALELVDWKTGQPKAEDSEQLVVYAAYAEAKYAAPPERVTGRLVYLKGKTAEEPAFPVTREDVDLFYATTRRELAEMRERHNRPESEFPKTTNLRACEWCAFQRECWPAGLPE